MLTVSNISKRFPGAEALLFQNVSFTVNPGERVGLIGPNGCGKTTLLRVILGELSADSGGVIFNPPDLRIGYLPQGLDVPDDTPLYDALFPQAAALRAAEADVERLAEAMAATTNGSLDAIMTAYADALERLEYLSRQIDPGEHERILAGLELDGVPLDAPVGTLSGGQKTRLGLAALLLNDPQLLILDEPTNHLDVTALEWLEDVAARLFAAGR